MNRQETSDFSVFPEMALHDDAVLVSRIAHRDREAFSELVRRYHVRLCQLLRRKIHHSLPFSADDVVQTMWEELWRRPPQDWVVIDDAWPLLMVAALNDLRSMCTAARTQKRMPKNGIERLGDAAHQKDETLSEAEHMLRTEEIRIALLAVLTPEERDVVLFRINGQGFLEDYARMRGMRKRTVERRMASAQRKIREIL